MDLSQVEAAKEILKPLISQVPDTLYGLERMVHIGKVVTELEVENKLAIKNVIDSLILRMPEIDASDIDMGSSGCRGKVWYRVQGAKNPDPEAGEYSEAETDFMLLSIIMEKQQEYLWKERNVDFSYVVGSGENEHRLRGDMYFDLGHIALNMRLIGSEIRPFAGFNFHPEIAKALSLKYVKQGLVLVTGITGSGKSSTLDSIIDANNRSVDAHMVILGSPIEQVHPSIRCIVRHREIGADVMSFKEGAIQALRQDPDIIVIGEMRDPETIITGLEITDSGHKVFSTLHTSSAVESIDRIIGEVPAEVQGRVRERLAEVLTVVISQKLVKTLDGKRAMAKEVLMVTPSIRAAIKNNNLDEIYQMLQQGAKLGMVTMEQDLKRLLEEKKISYEEALNNANLKKRFKEIVQFSA